MARRIRNISGSRIEVPLLGAAIEPGDVFTVPEEMSNVEFPENYFEVEDSDQGQAAETGTEPSQPQPQPQEPPQGPQPTEPQPQVPEPPQEG